MTVYSIHIIDTITSETVFKSIPVPKDHILDILRLVVVNLPFEIKLYNIMSSKYIDKNDLI